MTDASHRNTIHRFVLLRSLNTIPLNYRKPTRLKRQQLPHTTQTQTILDIANQAPRVLRVAQAPPGVLVDGSFDVVNRVWLAQYALHPSCALHFSHGACLALFAAAHCARTLHASRHVIWVHRRRKPDDRRRGPRPRAAPPPPRLLGPNPLRRVHAALHVSAVWNRGDSVSLNGAQLTCCGSASCMSMNTMSGGVPASAEAVNHATAPAIVVHVCAFSASSSSIAATEPRHGLQVQYARAHTARTACDREHERVVFNNEHTNSSLPRHCLLRRVRWRIWHGTRRVGAVPADEGQHSGDLVVDRFGCRLAHHGFRRRRGHRWRKRHLSSPRRPELALQVTGSGCRSRKRNLQCEHGADAGPRYDGQKPASHRLCVRCVTQIGWHTMGACSSCYAPPR